mgnify:CR=1 FL=1
MIYKFQSKATGDVIMLGPHGDQVMTMLGREPAAKGILEVQDLASLIARLEAAVADAPPPGAKPDDDAPAQPQTVALRARVRPLRDMMKRALAAREPIVWGV